MTRVAVLGTGSWGTAFALVCADAGSDVRLWGRRAELCDTIERTRENPVYQPGVRLPDGLRATGDAREALDGAEVVALVVPAQVMRATAAELAPLLPPDAVLVSLAKGLELGTDLRMTQVLAAVTGAGPERLAVLTGPNLAREIAERQPTAAVVGCTDPAAGLLVQGACRSAAFHPHLNADVIGCEVGGIMKNVVALAVGMASALGFGDNARASLITRGLAETSRLGVALGADPLTLAGLAGLGDLVATCSSPLSRNRAAGERLVRTGSTAPEGAAVGTTSEGVQSSVAVLDLATRLGVPLPLTERVVAAVRDGAPPASVLDALVADPDPLAPPA